MVPFPLSPWRRQNPSAKLVVVGVLLVGLMSIAACAASPEVAEATWPTSAEPLPAATSATGDTQITCGGRTFPVSGLSASPGAEKAVGPKFDALRQTLAAFEPEFPGSAGWTWRLAGSDPSGAVFVSQTDAISESGWAYVEVAVGDAGQHPGTIGSCDPRVVLSAEFGPATWALDPAFPAPGPRSTRINVLVWERSCSSGRPTTGRMSAPVIAYAATTVTITIGVRPLSGLQSCPGPPGTPALVELSEPLGSRTLFDGGLVPPAAPVPPY